MAEQQKAQSEISVSDVINSGWTKFTDSMVVWLAMAAIITAVQYIFQFITEKVLDVGSIQAFSSGDVNAIKAASGSLIVVTLVMAVVQIVLGAITLRQGEEAVVKGKKLTDIQEALNLGIKNLAPIIIASVVTFVLIGLGFILLFIPGLIAVFFLGLTPFIVADTNKGLGEAMSESAAYAQKFVAPWVLTVVSVVVVAISVSLILGIFRIPLITSFGSSVVQIFTMLVIFSLYAEMKKRFKAEA